MSQCDGLQYYIKLKQRKKCSANISAELQQRPQD